MAVSIEQSRTRLKSRIEELITASGVDLGTLGAAQQQQLVKTLTDGLIVTLDEMLNDLDDTPNLSQAPGGGDEQVLWEGRPFLSLVEHYTVTSQRIRIRRGLVGRATDDIELIRLQDIDMKQNVSERMVNIGDITLHSADKSEPFATLRNIHEPERVHEIIRSAMLEARRRQGVRLRDQF